MTCQNGNSVGYPKQVIIEEVKLYFAVLLCFSMNVRPCYLVAAQEAEETRI